MSFELNFDNILLMGVILYFLISLIIRNAEKDRGFYAAISGLLATASLLGIVYLVEKVIVVS